MDEKGVSKIVKAVGISSAAVGVIFLAGLGFLAYRNYFEVVKLKLQIESLKKGLAQAQAEAAL